MLDVKAAVKIASEYLAGIYEGIELHDVLLEEVELSKNGLNWLVTIGFSRPVPPRTVPTILQSLGGPQYKREYKVMCVDRTTSEVQSMKIRTLPSD